VLSKAPIHVCKARRLVSTANGHRESRGVELRSSRLFIQRHPGIATLGKINHEPAARGRRFEPDRIGNRYGA